jgi:hypothetical protein
MIPGGEARMGPSIASHMVSGVRDSVIYIYIYLLGLAPAGYLAAPDNGPWAGCGLVQVKASVDALCH